MEVLLHSNTTICTPSFLGYIRFPVTIYELELLLCRHRNVRILIQNHCNWSQEVIATMLHLASQCGALRHLSPLKVIIRLRDSANAECELSGDCSLAIYG